MNLKNYNPFKEIYWVSRMRENFTYDAYGEWLETDFQKYRANLIPTDNILKLKVIFTFRRMLCKEFKSSNQPYKACMVDFLFLKNKYPDKSIESASQNYVKNVYSMKFNIDGTLACAA